MILGSLFDMNDMIFSLILVRFGMHFLKSTKLCKIIIIKDLLRELSPGSKFSRINFSNFNTLYLLIVLLSNYLHVERINSILAVRVINNTATFVMVRASTIYFKQSFTSCDSYTSAFIIFTSFS